MRLRQLWSTSVEERHPRFLGIPGTPEAGNDWCCPFFIIIRINLCAMAILFCFRNWNLNRLILAGPITVVWCLASITWNTGGPLSSPALNLQDVKIARIKSEENKESGASSSVLHNQKTQSNLAQDQGSVDPDVIVFGVGDSGTRKLTANS